MIQKAHQNPITCCNDCFGTSRSLESLRDTAHNSSEDFERTFARQFVRAAINDAFALIVDLKTARKSISVFEHQNLSGEKKFSKN